MTLQFAIGVFLVAAIGGLIMAIQILKNTKPSVSIAVLHGILAASGLVLLLWTLVTVGGNDFVLGGLAALAVAALGGFFLASFHIRGLPHPRPVVFIHAGVAVLGVLALIGSFL